MYANPPSIHPVGFGIDFSEMYRTLPYIGVPTDAAVARVAAEAEVARAERLLRQQAEASRDPLEVRVLD